MTRYIFRFLALTLLAFLVAPALAQQKPFKIPSANLKEQIIWGSTCEGPDGFVLGFGGQDQPSDELPRTRIKKVDGQWHSLSEELRKGNPLQSLHGVALELAQRHQADFALGRAIFFAGLPSAEEARRRADIPLSENHKLLADAQKKLFVGLTEAVDKRKGYDKQQASAALARCKKHLEREVADTPIDAKTLQQGISGNADLQKLAEVLDSEPPARYLSPLAYDPKTRLFVLTAGDHGDYLTNDLWLFDPARKKWEQRHPETAPPPRGSHTLKANGDGTVTLSGGYTYTSSISYLGTQYKELKDGAWTYDIAANSWKGPDQGVPPDTRVYRTGPFHPDYFLQGAKPDAAAAKKELDAIPINRWVERKTPHKPEMVRTWGHAVLDPDHDQVLVFSGGHSAHCGSDVLHYHLSTNRWELPFPVEFPLGQTYSNTSFPEGYNLNKRPWMTGHTYQSYNYDPLSKKLYLNARVNNTYVYDPVVGDWIGRFPKPKSMVYHDCFYTMNTLPTPHGLICWTGHSGLFKLDAVKQEWQEVKRSGVKLPNSVVDSSTYVYDSKRDRLFFVRSDYGRKNDGDLHAFDMKTGAVTKTTPANAAALAALDLKGVDRAVYDAANDLVLFSTLLPGAADTMRRALAYDCAADKWVSLNLGYEIGKNKRAAHPGGPGHSCGLLFDAKRSIIWGIDTHDCRVYALRLELKGADVKTVE
jgi:hypothetical protein